MDSGSFSFFLPLLQHTLWREETWRMSSPKEEGEEPLSTLSSMLIDTPQKGGEREERITEWKKEREERMREREKENRREEERRERGEKERKNTRWSPGEKVNPCGSLLSAWNIRLTFFNRLSRHFSLFFLSLLSFLSLSMFSSHKKFHSLILPNREVFTKREKEEKEKMCSFGNFSFAVFPTFQKVRNISFSATEKKMRAREERGQERNECFRSPAAAILTLFRKEKEREREEMESVRKRMKNIWNWSFSCFNFQTYFFLKKKNICRKWFFMSFFSWLSACFWVMCQLEKRWGWKGKKKREENEERKREEDEDKDEEKKWNEMKKIPRFWAMETQSLFQSVSFVKFRLFWLLGWWKEFVSISLSFSTLSLSLSKTDCCFLPPVDSVSSLPPSLAFLSFFLLLSSSFFFRSKIFRKNSHISQQNIFWSSFQFSLLLSSSHSPFQFLSSSPFFLSLFRSTSSFLLFPLDLYGNSCDRSYRIQQ